MAEITPQRQLLTQSALGAQLLASKVELKPRYGDDVRKKNLSIQRSQTSSHNHLSIKPVGGAHNRNSTVDFREGPSLLGSIEKHGSQRSLSPEGMGSNVKLPTISDSRNAYDSLDAKTAKKLFGSLSIREVAFFKKGGEGKCLDGYEMPDPKLRFNFHNRDFHIPKSNVKNYINQIIHDKKNIPSPDKYAHLRPNFNDITKKSKIYISDRHNYMDAI